MAGIPSIAAIARQLGVAPSTVSKVLGPHAERYRIGTELRQRILACAESQGYRPDLRNRARATRRSGMVGVFFSSPSPTTHAVFEHLGTHLAEHLGRHGYRPCYLPAGDWREVRSRLAEHRIDGALLLPHLPREVPGVRPPESLPLVAINALTDLPVPQVVTDDVQGVGLLVDHLVGLGHRRIAYADVPGRPFGHYSEAWRRQGYREAMARHGLPLQEHAGEAADLLPWLEGRGGTAAITYNHQVALDLTREIRRRGLPVPGRFSFACASNIAVGALVDPAWTAVEIPLAAMVDRAVAELVAVMEGRQPLGPQRIVIPQGIVVRASTGAAPPA